MTDRELAPKRHKGRPRKDIQGDVAQRLLVAAELLLRDKSHYDLTEREIAAKAAVSEAMIHYYFGDKDGLLFAVIVRCGDEVSERLKALDNIDTTAPDATREIFRVMLDAYYSKPWVAKIAVSEFARTESAIKTYFMKRYGTKGQGLVKLHRVFEKLIDDGIFDKRVNPAHAALSMFSIIIAPLVLAPLSVRIEIELDEVKQDEWIDYVADLFDRQLRPARTDDRLP